MEIGNEEREAKQEELAKSKDVQRISMETDYFLSIFLFKKKN